MPLVKHEAPKIWYGLRYLYLKGALGFIIFAMLFLSTLSAFIHKLQQLVQLPDQNYPTNEAKGDQDSYSDTKVTLTKKLSITPLPTSAGSAKPRAIYNGGYEDAKIQGVRLRIANGGAGQTGFIGAWADAFIQHMVSKGMPPFEVRVLYPSRELTDWTANFGRQGCVVSRGHHRQSRVIVVRYRGCCPYLQLCGRKTSSWHRRRSRDCLWLPSECYIFYLWQSTIYPNQSCRIISSL